jgi:hypothetical protein
MDLKKREITQKRSKKNTKTNFYEFIENAKITYLEKLIKEERK